MAEGWYADPHRRAHLRWWDGSGWTDHEHGRPTVPLRAALVGLVVLVLARLLVEAAIRPLRASTVPVWAIGALFYVVVFGSMVATARAALWPGRTLRGWLGEELRFVDLGHGLLVWLTTILSAVVTASLVRALDLPFRTNNDVIEVYRDRDMALFLVTAVAAVIGAPIVEELFFRGLVQRGLRDRLPAWAAIATQAVLFGLYHLIPGYGSANIGLVLVLTGYGLVFGAWAHQVGRLGPTMVGHAVTNGLVVLVLAAS